MLRYIEPNETKLTFSNFEIINFANSLALPSKKDLIDLDNGVNRSYPVTMISVDNIDEKTSDYWYEYLTYMTEGQEFFACSDYKKFLKNNN